MKTYYNSKWTKYKLLSCLEVIPENYGETLFIVLLSVMKTSNFQAKFRTISPKLYTWDVRTQFPHVSQKI